MEPDAFVQAGSAATPDWSRERVQGFWDPGRKLLRALRKYQAAQAQGTGMARLRARYWSVCHMFWSWVTQCEIPLACEIGGGLLLPHPTGIVIHPDCCIGPNCLIFHQVTLARDVTMGGHCDIGAGAKLLGPLRVGNHVQVGANAVVTINLPDTAVAIGVPARISAQQGD